MVALDETHDPARESWVASAQGHADFPCQNLPLGVFSRNDTMRHFGVAIGDEILDVGACLAAGLLEGDALRAGEAGCALADGGLNALLAQPASVQVALRRRLSALLSESAQRSLVQPMLRHAADCTLHLPARIGDYTDFYAGIHHATTVGSLFRPDQPLLPNYKHVPIGYHGRASSVLPSGVAFARPHGQRLGEDSETPVFGPSRRLDFELELGVWIGAGNRPGEPIAIGKAADHIAGFCLLNDWSARDIQAWEYQPLGPFLAKSFATTVSPWIVTAAAMAPFRVAQRKRPDGDPQPLAYLSDANDQLHGALDLRLEVFLSTAQMRAAGLPPHQVTSADARDLYWTVAQMVTHHASGGCNLRPGDLLGTGTISSLGPNGAGSLLEATQGGRVALPLPSGEERRFLEDGDEVIMCANAQRTGAVTIGFGVCSGRVEGSASF